MLFRVMPTHRSWPFLYVGTAITYQIRAIGKVQILISIRIVQLLKKYYRFAANISTVVSLRYQNPMLKE